MGDVFIWRLFNQIAIRPSVWGEKGDRELVDRNLKEDVPAVLDYLEAEAPAEGFRFGALSLADIAIAAFFRNAGWVRFQIDAARWPRAAAWMARTLAHPAFAKLARIEDAVLRTPIAEQRDALKVAGRSGQRRDLRRSGAAPRRHADLDRAAHPSLRLRPCHRRLRCRRGRRRLPRFEGADDLQQPAGGQRRHRLAGVLVAPRLRRCLAGSSGWWRPSPTR